MKKSKTFFFEKKNQKTFVNWAWCVQRYQPKLTKFFCCFFFKKSSS